MFYFNEGDRVEFISDTQEVSVIGDFELGETVVCMVPGESNPIVGYQVVYFANGEFV